MRLSRRFRLCRSNHWPGPRSLATTSGVSVDVLSSGYLDVSVRRVRLPHLWIQCGIPLRSGGLPHSEIHGSKPARGSPWLIATCCVLHRLSVPRHPPDALQTLDPLQRLRHAQGQAQAHAQHRKMHQTCEPTPSRGAGPRSVLGHLTIVFTLSMIPLQSPAWGARSSRFRVAFPSDGSPRAPPSPRHQKTGGGRRDRTDDLLLAKQALSQLSYAPLSV